MIEQRAGPWTDATRPGSRIGHAIEVHDMIGSTNDRARALLAEGRPGVVVVAELQSAGRGRRGRGWESPPGLNLTASVGIVCALRAADAWQLGMAAGLGLHDACMALARAPVELKWPNDLVAADGRKLGGLLLETTVQGDRLRGAVIGFGINVNWRRADMPAELARSATALVELAGGELDRVVLLRSALERLERELEPVEAGASPLVRYRAACSTLGRVVSVETADGAVDGHAVDIDERGSLVVEGPDGRVAVSSGEVVRVRRTGR